MNTPRASLSVALLTVALLVAAWPGAGLAAPFRDFPVVLTQPWGERVPALATGDEHHRRLFDATGRTLVMDPDTGAWVYATIDAGRLVPTAFVPGQVDPATVGLPPFLDVPRETLGAHVTPLPLPQGHVPARAPQSGTLNNLVVFVRFADEAEFGEASSTFDALFNTGTASLRGYYAEASYGKLTVNTHFLPAPSGGSIVSVQDWQTRNYYRPWSATNPDGYWSDYGRAYREQALVYYTLMAVQDAIPAGLDLDADQDGVVDNVTFVVSGEADGWSDLLWSHMWELFLYDATLNGARVATFDLIMRNQLDLTTLAHELFHSLGAPDLYHYSYDGRTTVGDWDLMEYGRGHMSAWMKARYGGWLTLPTLGAGLHTLNPLTSATGSAGIIPLDGAGTSQLVVEYRRQAGTFESNLPGSGLVIYRVDTASNGNADGPPDEVYVFRPGGTPTSDGTPWDAHFSADVGRTAFGPGTDPYPFLPDGTPLDVRIDHVSGAGATLSFVLNDCAAACLGRECGDDGCGGSCGTCAPDEVCQEGQCGSCLDAQPPTCDQVFVAPGTSTQPETVWLTGSWLGWPATPAAGAIPLTLGSFAGDPTAWAVQVALPSSEEVQYKYLVKWPDAAVQWCVVTPTGGWSCANDPNMTLTCMPPCADFCVPALEFCNGKDDDCDGLTDEGVAGCCVASCDGRSCGDDGCFGSCGACPEGKACFDGTCGVCLDPAPTACDQVFVAPGTPVQPDFVWLTGSWLGWAASPATGAIPLALGVWAPDPSAWTASVSLPLFQPVEYKYLVKWPDTDVQWCVVVAGGSWSCVGDPNMTATCAPPCADVCTPAVETCNHVDDDCDGQTDEGLGGCCTPSCTGRLCGDDGCGGSCGACDDGDACTFDTCVEATGQCQVVVAPDGLPCNDHDACTHVDACQAGACVGSDTVTCPATGPCRLPGTCDPATGTCDDPAKPDGLPCDDGDACTQVDACQAGACVGQSPVTCRAPDVCELSVTCDPATGTCEAALTPFGVSCDDGDACTAVSFCSSGACVGAQPVVCTAADACHEPGTCDPATGLCSTPVAADGASCNDGDACTRSDACHAGACVGSDLVVCSAADACHVPGACDPATGQCSDPAAPDGTPCSDGLFCTDGDACTSGACQPGASRTCPAAAESCHHAACDEAADACASAPDADGTACTDGSACTRSDTCQAGACVGADPVACTAADACHVAGACDPATGACSNPTAPDGKPCGNPQRCDGGLLERADACDAAGHCVDAGTASCVPYKDCASATACAASCTGSAQCLSGYDCIGGACLVNQPPVADAGAGQQVGEAVWVTLDGQASHDPEGQPLVFAWSQQSGPTVLLDDAHVARPRFVSPTVFAEATLSFRLVVSDGLLESSPSEAYVFVLNDVNEAPVASAFAETPEVDEGDELSLDGSDSFDPNGQPLAYQWTQLEGPEVALDDPAAAVVAGVAPQVDVDTWLTFDLVVDDGTNASAPIQVQVLVHDTVEAEPGPELPGPNDVEGTPDDSAPDVVEPGPDVVEPGPDVVEPGPDAFDATLPDAATEASPDATEASPDAVTPDPGAVESSIEVPAPDGAVSEKTPDGATPDLSSGDSAQDPAGPDGPDGATADDGPLLDRSGSGSGCALNSGAAARPGLVVPLAATLALLVLVRRRSRSLRALGLVVLVLTLAGCLSATRQRPDHDASAGDTAADLPSDLAADAPADALPDQPAEATPDTAGDTVADTPPAPSDAEGTDTPADVGPDTCPELPCSPGDHPELLPGPCEQLAWSPAACACVVVPVQAPTPCDDGNPCTIGDGCKDGACDPGLLDPACSCNPAADTCEAEHGDHDACNGTLHCVGGLCSPDPATLPAACDNSGLPPCQQRACVPATGLCGLTTADDGKPCSDGAACTLFDYCSGGECNPGSPRDCNDADPCTADVCIAGTGLCKHTLTPSGDVETCNDADDDCDGQTDEEPSLDEGALCSPSYVCVEGACVVSCSDDADCTANHVCVTAADGTGECVSACVASCPAGLGYRTFDGCHCRVPPTGADTCLIPGGWALCDALSPGDEGYGQDATFGHEHLLMTDLLDGTVRDDLTGVLWSKTLLPTGETVAGAKDACSANAAGLPGANWGLPALHALFGIVNYAVDGSPFWDRAVFGSSGGWVTWSATPAPAGGGNPYMFVDFSKAEVVLSDSSNELDVRCARLPLPASVPDRYAVNRQGHVLDRLTGLVWRVQNACAQCTWYAALEACLALGDGWRVPDAKEALSLVDYSVEGCTTLPPPFGGDCLTYSEYWTSTPTTDARAAAIDAGIGYLQPKATTEKLAVRCVRDAH